MTLNRLRKQKHSSSLKGRQLNGINHFAAEEINKTTNMHETAIKIQCS